MNHSHDIQKLQSSIEALEIENAMLRRDFSTLPKGDSVIVPQELKPLFDVAQQTVGNYFTNLQMDPTKGTIEINGQRYLLVRASALSKDFLDTIQNLYADRGEAAAIGIGKNFLFDISHALGMNDAKNFHAEMNLTEPIARLSAGPVHFAYTGWAFVHILPESNPLPDENYYLIYHHPYSFEADSWMRSGKQSDTPVCIMNAGYSSGWCEESFGIPLTAVEVSCRAKGDPNCTFIMSPPHRIGEHLKQFQGRNQMAYGKSEGYEIPTFFDRKRIEEELQKSRALAEASAKSKSDFVANMSHELRTPLGAILGFTDLLKKTDLSDVQQDYLEAIKTSGNSLLAIINDILDLSKLDAGKFIIETVPFHIPDLLHSLQVMMATKAREKSLVLTIAADASIRYGVLGDPMRLTQILTNLVGNAIKFTESGEVNVTCRVDEETEQTAILTFKIQDTGIGIPEDKQALIFERFTQADTDTTRKYGGTGLGLAITKQLIELLGGTISVKSKEGAGTSFYFTLPYQKAAIRQFAPAPASPVPSQPGTIDKTILVVEDHPLNQKLTAIMLHNNGYRTVLAENGSIAVSILKKQVVDLILMDIQMPVMDGYQATCIIRDELHVSTPIIAMTAHALAGEKEKCFQQGINDYLPKPFTEEDLLLKMGRWIKGHQPAENKERRPQQILTDLAFLKKQTRNNAETISEMIALFIDQNPRDMQLLQQAIGAGDYYTIYKTVHIIRNAVALFGLTAFIGDELLIMEKLSHNKGPLSEIEVCFAKIKRVCEQAAAELQSYKI